MKKSKLVYPYEAENDYYFSPKVRLWTTLCYFPVMLSLLYYLILVVGIESEILILLFFVIVVTISLFGFIFKKSESQIMLAQRYMIFDCKIIYYKNIEKLSVNEGVDSSLVITMYNGQKETIYSAGLKNGSPHQEKKRTIQQRHFNKIINKLNEKLRLESSGAIMSL